MLPRRRYSAEESLSQQPLHGPVQRYLRKMSRRQNHDSTGANAPAPAGGLHVVFRPSVQEHIDARIIDRHLIVLIVDREWCRLARTKRVLSHRLDRNWTRRWMTDKHSAQHGSNRRPIFVAGGSGTHRD